MPAQLSIEGVTADPQLFRRVGHVPALLLQRREQRQALGVPEATLRTAASATGCAWVR